MTALLLFPASFLKVFIIGRKLTLSLKIYMIIKIYFSVHSLIMFYNDIRGWSLIWFYIV